MLRPVTVPMFTGETGASLARTQDEGAVGFCVEDEDTASGVPGRRERGKRCRTGHQNATFRIPVTMMFASASGISTFQASAWSWSSRRRG